MISKEQNEIPLLRIQLLGPPRIFLNEQLININRREHRALLYFLAGNNEPVSRNIACEFFWQNDSETSSRKKLREALSRIRAALKNPVYLISHHDSIMLNPELVKVDYQEYMRVIIPLIGSAEINSTGKLPEWCYRQLREVITTYDGIQFLQGINMPDSIGFENWVGSTNQIYVLSRDRILQRLADHSIASGNLDEALFWLELAIRSDPLNVDLCYLKAYCLKEQGRIQDAINFINLLESFYQSNHHEPLPKSLTDFRKRMESMPLQDHDVLEALEWPIADANQVPFVSREDLLKKLSNAYYRKGVICIIGESGSGKSRLVEEFYSRFEFKPILVYCSSKLTGSILPLESVFDGVKKALEPGIWQELPESIRDDLAPYFTEFNEENKKDGSINSATFDIDAILRLYNGLLFLLKKISENKPLLMVMENAQQCDEITLNLFSFLTERNFFKQNGLLVFTAQVENYHPGFWQFLDRGILSYGLEEIHLQPFSTEEVSRFAAMMLGRVIGYNLAERLRTLTGGNPFFLIQIIRSLKEFNLQEDFLAQTEKFPLPEEIRAMVYERIRLLSQPALSMIQNAAVLGQQFPMRVLEEMTRLKNDDFLDVVEELQNKSILIASIDDHDETVYSFAHGLVRTILLIDISPVRLRSQHLLAIEALKKVKGNAPKLAATYAEHFDGAGEKANAFKSWCEAGRYSISIFSEDDVKACYQKALNLLPSLQKEEMPVLLNRLITEWGDYAYDLDDTSTCRMLYEKAMEYGEAHQNTVLIADALCGFGRLAEMQGQFDEGIDSLNRALFFLKNTKDKQRLIETYSRLGFLFEIKHDYSRARSAFEEGLKIEKDLSDKKMLDSAVNLETRYSLLVCMMGFPSLAEEIADKAVNESLLVSRQSARVQAYAALAVAQYYCGKYKRSFQNAVAVYKLACQLNLSRWKILLDLVLAKDYLASGFLDESWSHVQSAMEHRDILIMKDLDVFSTTVLGDIYRLLGDLPAAEEQYNKGAKQPLDNLQSLENYYLLGLTKCLRGNVDEGASIIREAAEKAVSLGFEGVSMLAGLYAYTFSSEGLNDESLTRDILPIIKKMEERGFGSGKWNAALLQGEIALKQGKMEQAKKIFSDTLRIAHDMDHHWVELWALTSLAAIQENDKAERYHYQQLAMALLDEMSEHAIKKPLNTLFGKFRKQVIQYLNL